MSDVFQSYADEMLSRAVRAAEEWRQFDQAQADRVVDAIFRAAWDARAHLARLAHEETGMGVVEHKTLKNAWAALVVSEKLRGAKTVGAIAEDHATGITDIAEPVGPVLGTLPLTNPTSTAIFKALICAKTRNPIIFSPHRGVRKCSKEAARILSAAAEGAGAPAGTIQVITRSQSEYVHHVMRHRRLALILATGTPAIVDVARQSGTPTFGVGPGNVPVFVHATANLERAARSIVESKTFDNGTICASEQAVVLQREQAAALRAALEQHGAFFCSEEQAASLGPVCFDAEHRRMRADVVGQPAAEIARRAGIAVPADTRVLVAVPGGVGPDYPLSAEILAPVLAWYEAATYEEALETCRLLLRWGGTGHTLGVYTTDSRVVSDFSAIGGGRILVNQPTTQGAYGGIVNLLPPSLTLSCGTGAHNITTDNITYRHLLNVYRVVRPHPNRGWLAGGPTGWLNESLDADAAQRKYRSADGN